MLHKRIPAEAGISVVCVSPGIVDTNVVSSITNFFIGFDHLCLFEKV
jgi:NAD(P)-dependent dehydrogenase (short-subunit alcohol dehydrogenase family)